MASSRIQIGHYVLGETLGTGSFGKVKRKLTSKVAAMNDFI